MSHKVPGAGMMSDKSVTELVSNLRRPIGGDGHVWLATRGPGEFVGKLTARQQRCHTMRFGMLHCTWLCGANHVPEGAAYWIKIAVGPSNSVTVHAMYLVP